ncbi:E3 ubiquitin-protein ligase rnf168-like, partial [Anarrhichthys ocellatus]|uniref:E3 ubiquitin-protein ligase rnf168-like n=1 Tax=Anarrhichthys ocellatus TaxID=433405 RepID=UPI0012ED74D8
ENILVSQVERPPPRLDYYRSDPPSASVEVHFHPWTHGSHMTGDGSSKRKSSELEESAPPGADMLGIAELEAELLSRQRQEGEDRRLALLLQKELDQEEKQRATDRRRGSSDPYPLRQPTRTSSKTCTPSSSGKPPTRPSRKTCTPTRPSTKTPTSSSSSRKQATLTEMFSGSPSVSR